MSITPENFKKLRVNLELTQAQYGAILGFKPKSAGRRVRAYESGETPIDGTVSKLVLYIARHGVIE